MDPVEKVFRDLPSPDADQATQDQHGEYDQQRYKQVFMSFRSSRSQDPDRELVEKYVRALSESLDATTLRSELGRLALEKPQILDDGSMKSQQLKYHAWISQGRKDEAYPFKPKTKLTDTKICANCAKPNAKAACSGCRVELDGHVVMKIAYCDKDCQAQHWEQHKSQCLGRRKVCRAVSLLYDLFAMFQKKASNDKQVTGIVEKHGITNILHGEPNDWALQGKHFVCNFPVEMAPTEEHALAVLFDSECQQVFSTCQGLVSLFLLPLCKTVEEVNIIPRNAHRPTNDLRHGMAHNAMYNAHTVLRATLKSGEQMAIDVTGAQFGWRETVALWKTWTTHRVTGKACPTPWGHAQQSMQTMYPFLAAQFVQVSESQRSSLAQIMQTAVENKMKEHKAPSANRLYKLGDAAFAACKDAMMSSAEEALDNGLRDIHESGVGRCYIDARGMWQATTTKQQAQALKDVWLTDEDVKKAVKKGKSLQTMYQLRCQGTATRQKFKAAGLDMP
ncbi:hypothetical protein F5B22DRAFT_637597 [Xylaria bambusicola]|uniref:uncharacterized protein n=1 Tax=Xylaria bambusicola TaxID=326684 RepID=UPI00200863DB|nr:uncharacterized protein F5B22DRAFT_637597 [Xylaria bambusicola]KAI0512793.1 hypothetical protein F5B22DRAFT_637597 [Xylaria bambusicola]